MLLGVCAVCDFVCLFCCFHCSDVDSKFALTGHI